MWLQSRRFWHVQSIQCPSVVLNTVLRSPPQAPRKLRPNGDGRWRSRWRGTEGWPPGQAETSRVSGELEQNLIHGRRFICFSLFSLSPSLSLYIYDTSSYCLKQEGLTIPDSHSSCHKTPCDEYRCAMFLFTSLLVLDQSGTEGWIHSSADGCMAWRIQKHILLAKPRLKER